jgi:hypothetical protein
MCCHCGPRRQFHAGPHECEYSIETSALRRPPALRSSFPKRHHLVTWSLGTSCRLILVLGGGRRAQRDGWGQLNAGRGRDSNPAGPCRAAVEPREVSDTVPLEEEPDMLDAPGTWRAARAPHAGLSASAIRQASCCRRPPKSRRGHRPLVAVWVGVALPEMRRTGPRWPPTSGSPSRSIGRPRHNV